MQSRAGGLGDAVPWPIGSHARFDPSPHARPGEIQFLAARQVARERSKQTWNVIALGFVLAVPFFRFRRRAMPVHRTPFPLVGRRPTVGSSE